MVDGWNHIRVLEGSDWLVICTDHHVAAALWKSPTASIKSITHCHSLDSLTLLSYLPQGDILLRLLSGAQTDVSIALICLRQLVCIAQQRPLVSCPSTFPPELLAGEHRR